MFSRAEAAAIFSFFLLLKRKCPGRLGWVASRRRVEIKTATVVISPHWTLLTREKKIIIIISPVFTLLSRQAGERTDGRKQPCVCASQSRSSASSRRPPPPTPPRLLAPAQLLERCWHIHTQQRLRYRVVVSRRSPHPLHPSNPPTTNFFFHFFPPPLFYFPNTFSKSEVCPLHPTC